ncbi:MAG TPA: hypothetical protein VH684_08955 [Xanthobacteraceae bacterium]|jgi:hypothetical protein
MKAFDRNLNLLRIPIGFLMASAMTALAWGGEQASTSDAVAQPVSPQDFSLPHDFLDPNFLNYGNFGADPSAADRKLTAPKTASPGEKNRFDVKTDYDVDVQKFLPADGFPLYGPSTNGNSQQNGGPQKKKPFFFGLSVTKPIN